jgi:Putative auto-transporter adhesin, head GIN domain
MKKIIILLCCISTLFACKNYRSIKGNGEIIIQQREIVPFEKVLSEIAGDIIITCQAGEKYSCVIEAESNLVPLFETKVAQNELVITYKDNANVNATKPITIKITCPQLIGTKLLGSGNLTVNGTILSPKFDASQMGSGNIDLNNATIGALRVNLSGSGEITLKNCTSLNAEYALLGSGNINANGNATKTCKAKITGSGTIDAVVTDTLDAEITGSGDIDYEGNPTVINKTITGSGGINKK